MAGIKPLDMAGNQNVGIGWELNRCLQTILSASDLDRLFESFSAWMRSILFIRLKLLQWIGTILKPDGWKFVKG